MSIPASIEAQPPWFFQRMLTASTNGIVITDPRQPDNPIVYVNPAFEVLTGYRLDDIAGQNCRLLQNGDRHQPPLTELRDSIAEERPCTTTLRNYRKDGSMLWVRMHIFPMHDQGGRLMNYAGFLQDVTSSIEAREAAENAREHLSAVLESITDGCLSLDRAWRITYINERGAAWLGHDPADLIGKSIWTEFPDTAASPFLETYQQAASTRRMARCEGYYSSLGIWMEARVYPTPEGISVFFADISARKEAEARLLHLATHDSLTGLHNRFSCMRVLEAALADAEQGHHPVGVLFVDLDRFKEVNDAYGHQIGNQVLQELGRRLSAFSAEGTTVARISGDEFVFVLTRTEAAAARKLAQAVLQRLAAPVAVDGHHVTVGASIGIAIGDGDIRTPDELLNNADAAMYEAKANGRHTFSVFSAAETHLLKQRMQLRQELFNALEQRQFVLYYQPQICAGDGVVVGAEALLRWNHPRLGILAPGTFLPILEDSPAMAAVGAWVCEEACRQAREWEGMGYRLQMAVNVSPRQLTDENLPALLKALVERHGLDPESIKLEVTESMLMQDIDKAAQVLRQLMHDGFHIALDDFGTGYSNLSYLRRFPINTIKIDRSFVQEIEQDRRCLDIVNGVVAFAKSLKLSVICEGIETEGQRSALRSTGCDVLQGYLMGKPMADVEFRRLLAQSPKPKRSEEDCWEPEQTRS
ncbi:EAL domain-containing protein [Massilia forsythiae]|uniref:EAL domain-containing protein n=1 Tax=Massilia forsythiae TaxID=2728020 RepID=A0A7Z2ZR04_9BURK|nr:EAL domain-containing protein [Massilia forsythiae]QJD98962.1 EAL domain-containing protein [Massilia forsythiae]